MTPRNVAETTKCCARMHTALLWLRPLDQPSTSNACRSTWALHGLQPASPPCPVGGPKRVPAARRASRTCPHLGAPRRAVAGARVRRARALRRAERRPGAAGRRARTARLRPLRRRDEGATHPRTHIMGCSDGRNNVSALRTQQSGRAATTGGRSSSATSCWTRASSRP
jgi:hypothetical protein